MITNSNFFIPSFYSIGIPDPQGQTNPTTIGHIATPVSNNYPQSFQDFIMPYLASDNIDKTQLSEIRKSIYDKFPPLQNFVQLTLDPSNMHKFDYVNTLYVLAGIKPVLVVEQGYDYLAPLQNFSSFFSNLNWIKSKSGDHLLINEHPLPEFDPRRFINNFDGVYSNLAAITPVAFRNQNKLDTDKLLSYLLGYGPTWEAYAGINKLRYLSSHTSLSIFSDEHYYQLGKALYAKENGDSSTLLSRERLIELGQQFSLKAASYPWPKFTPFDLPKEIIAIERLYMNHHVGPIGFNTEYIQAGMKYRRRLLELFGIPLKAHTQRE
jgi:hypothetical protein